MSSIPNTTIITPNGTSTKPEAKPNGVNGVNGAVAESSTSTNDTELAEKFFGALSNSLTSVVTRELTEKLKAAEAAVAASKPAGEVASQTKKRRSRRNRGGSSEEKGDDDEEEEEEEKTYKPSEMQTELNKVDVIKDESGETKFVPWDDKRTGLTGDEAPPDSHSAWVLVLRRSWVEDYNGKTRAVVKLDFKSPVIRKVVKVGAPSLAAAMEGDKASIDWPNDELFRYRDHIMRAAEADSDPLAVPHTDVLIDLIHDKYGQHISEIETMFPKGTTTFRVLREAFWEDELVYHPCSQRLFKITYADYRQDRNGKYLMVNGNYVDSDGTDFGWVRSSFQVREFAGVAYFKDLAAVPIKYLDEEPRELLKAKLLERGRKFAALKGQHYKDYNGIAMSLDDEKPEPHSITSRIMVDTKTFNRLETSFAINVNSFKMATTDELTEEQLMLCTDKIPIFSFQDKKFYIASVKSISDIVFNDNVFSQLVLPEAHKDLVRVLVENHSKGAAFDDFIAGKGKGLISVLHGPPGVGKTMTAEAVSEHTRRPLYIVTSGELGSTPTEMEDNLERVLDLAKTFRAVLLLDEADVFLEQRTTHDLVRNALVSIFLRQLEYYQGILFLTTNRVATFDEAFHSRIHISLHYAPLTVEAREKVWRNFGERMDGGVELEEGDYRRFAEQEDGLNGRQIKNVFRTAQALAADKGVKVGVKQVEQVLSVMKAFDLKRMKE